MRWTKWDAETHGHDVFAGWSDSARKSITEAMEHAEDRGSSIIGQLDLAVVLARDAVIHSLHRRGGLDGDAIIAAMEGLPSGAGTPNGFDEAARTAAIAAWDEAALLGHQTVLPLHLWLSLLADPIVQATLAQHEIPAQDVREAVIRFGGSND